MPFLASGGCSNFWHSLSCGSMSSISAAVFMWPSSSWMLNVWDLLYVILMSSEDVDVHIGLRSTVLDCGPIRRKGPNVVFLKSGIVLTSYLWVNQWKKERVLEKISPTVILNTNNQNHCVPAFRILIFWFCFVIISWAHILSSEFSVLVNTLSVLMCCLKSSVCVGGEAISCIYVKDEL